MNKLIIVLCIVILAGLTVGIGLCQKEQKMKELNGVVYVEDVADIKALFPKTAAQITQETNTLLEQTKKDLGAIIAIPNENRTFQNTIQSLDTIISLSPLAVKGNLFQTLEMTSPQEAIRTAAHDAMLKIQSFWVDAVSTNRALYNACKWYAEHVAPKENLTQEEKYYLQDLIEGFERSGLHLPDEQLEHVKKLKKELAQLSLEYEKNLAEDKSSITVEKEGLVGLTEDFINQLKRTDDGKYILGVDYPTNTNVMENCAVEDTRKRLSIAFANRAYPANEEILKKIISVRDELAKVLGFESYAQLDLADQMVKTPERAREFVEDLWQRALNKDKQEYIDWTQDLPESVTLLPDGKIKPWDVAYLKAWYKKKNFDVDERVIAEYFPMESTIEGLLDIYRQFLSVEFVELPITRMWHEDVKLIAVYTKDKSTLLGYLFLDLHPRPNKYSHACHISLIHAYITKDGKRLPAVSTVLANFPKATADKPALLMRSDVRTFFHEFGHALHALFGATQMGGFAGTSVKRDFVELPSQMLEEWLNDKAMLKKVSKHYKTGQPLEDDVIDRIIALKNFESGSFIQVQSAYSLLSLDIFGPGANKDPYVMVEKLQLRMRPHVAFNKDSHMYANFGHLTGYGAKYYGYLWSRVFALDLFNEIKKEGLLNPIIGKRYVDEILSKGGSVDPNILLKNFLGREPNNAAFIEDMGLKGEQSWEGVLVPKEQRQVVPTA